ncbi:hypothetical protein [Bacillus phage SBSphiJ6]|nr:hypothetical protein [Bacillus phage SBSphiJ2]UPI12404.1 hypothetical protein [Bacillus phage SBSphiJ3]UPI12904.1 hypothetical protein [Bacillus phage SBSphiJ5]UPI13146.1 hypothetical protein [Bacillus phage SBSphiJ6]
METLTAFAVTMYGVVIASLFANLLQQWRETKELKRKGKTPLTGKNTATVICAALGEAVVVTLVFLVLAAAPTTLSVWGLGVTAVGCYLIKEPAAYLSAWACWSLFLKIEKRKRVAEIKKDQEGAI